MRTFSVSAHFERLVLKAFGFPFPVLYMSGQQRPSREGIPGRQLWPLKAGARAEGARETAAQGACAA